MNMGKKLMSVIMTAVMCASMVVTVSHAEEAELVNVALKENNGYVNVISASNPLGGTKDASGKPLAGLNDGKKSDGLGLGSGYLYLTQTEQEKKVTDTNTKYNHNVTTHVCLDLGMTYDISKIVFYGTSHATSGCSMANTRIYATNDARATGDKWREIPEESLYTVKDFGTKIGSQGNKILKDGSVSFEFGKEADNDATVWPADMDNTTPTETHVTIDRAGKAEYRYIIISKGSFDNDNSGTELICKELEVYAAPLAEYPAREAGVFNIADFDTPGFDLYSASNPEGGENENADKPLFYGFVDGSKYSGDAKARLDLENVDSSGTGTETKPLYDVNNPISICVDLGKEYEVSEFVLHGREVDMSFANLDIYTSNDPKAKTSDWLNAELTTVKDFGTKKSNEGNKILANEALRVQYTDKGAVDSTNYLARPKTDSSFRYIIISKVSPSVTYADLRFTELEVFVAPPKREEGTVNIASFNTEGFGIYSASHPGSDYRGFVDGSNISGTESANLWLITKQKDYDVTKPTSVCIDLGAEYDVSEIELFGRPTDVSYSNFDIYASNDPKAYTDDWLNAEKTIIKDFGTDGISGGNYLPANGSLRIDFTDEYSTESNTYIARPTSQGKFRYLILAKVSSAPIYAELIFGELKVYVNLPEEIIPGMSFTNIDTPNAAVLSARADVAAKDNAAMFMAQYDGNGELLAVKMAVNENNADEIIMTDIPKETGVTEVKLMLWNKETQRPLAESKTKIFRNDAETVAIACWGDSITRGVGGNGTTYPSTLSEKLADRNITVYNMGVGGETAYTIAGRQGAIPMAVNAFTIPAAAEEKVEITFSNANAVRPLMQTGVESDTSAGLNPCTINGVEGKITYEGEMSWNDETSKYYFERTQSGEATAVSQDTQVITAAMANPVSDTAIFFVGQNGPSDTDELVAVQKALIEKNATDRYIIVGLTTKSAADRKALEERMVSEFGEKYLNMREYLSSKEALKSVGITPTEDDISLIFTGSIPKSFWRNDTDNVHLNAAGYTAMGNKIYEKLWELGYIN